MFRWLILITLLLAAPAQAQVRASDVFAVDGIDVDVLAPTAQQARDAAFRQGYRKGWEKLWQKLTGKEKAPGVGDGQLETMVTAVDVTSERLSAKRYVARLGIAFDPAAVRRILASSGSSFALSRSRPMILLPVLEDGGMRFAYEPGNSWAEAWGRFGVGRTQIDYVRAAGSPTDVLLLSPFITGDRSPDRARIALMRYQADGFILARARVFRTFSGGPVSVAFDARPGLSAPVAERFTLSAKSDAELPALFDQAIERLDRSLNVALRGTFTTRAPVALGSTGKTGGIEVTVPTLSMESWVDWKKRIQRAASVTSVGLSSLAEGESRLQLSFSGNLDQLRFDLDSIGLRLDGPPEAYRLRERRPEEAPLPPPAPPQPVEGTTP
jgi:Uncharacterized protein conserved in bacteria (DUF2066)